MTPLPPGPPVARPPGVRLRVLAVHDAEAAYRDRGTLNTMRTTIDKAGRLVIPRPIRDRIGLAGGGEVEIELDGAAIRIEPVGGNGLREDGGLLLIPASGMPLTAAAVRELIDADRHGR
jgi:AbrB family looped-hinge helix DNA binding protein